MYKRSFHRWMRVETKLSCSKNMLILSTDSVNKSLFGNSLRHSHSSQQEHVLFLNGQHGVVVRHGRTCTTRSYKGTAAAGLVLSWQSQHGTEELMELWELARPQAQCEGTTEVQQHPSGSSGHLYEWGNTKQTSNLAHSLPTVPIAVPDHLFWVRAPVCKELKGK